jgi:hypothetical protein
MSAEAGKAVVHAFMDAFNRGDLAAWADTLNYPHIRLAAGVFTIIPTREDFLQRNASLKASLAAEGWHHTVLESLDVIHAGPDKVHMTLENTRRHADGSVYTRFQTVWIATLQDDHWGIQFRSSYLEE